MVMRVAGETGKPVDLEMEGKEERREERYS